jgi:formate hydrogenlyase subunit 4
LVVWLGSVVTLFIVLQVETARLPVDDPTTHLELTMVHEVMVLDHSGPDLGAIQYGSALKLYVGASMLATMLNPFAGTPGVLSVLMNLGLSVLIAIAVGTIESLIARFKLRSVPKYIVAAVVSAAVALLATAWRSGT